MKSLHFAGAFAVLLASQAQAAEPELSLDARRMLAYGAIAVVTGICKSPLTPEQDEQMKTGMQKAAEAQRDVTQAELTEAMKAIGTRVGENKEQMCASFTPEFIANGLKNAAQGEY